MERGNQVIKLVILGPKIVRKMLDNLSFYGKVVFQYQYRLELL